MYKLKQLFFSISVNNGFYNIYKETGLSRTSCTEIQTIAVYPLHAYASFSTYIDFVLGSKM